MNFRALIDSWRNRRLRERWLIGAPIVALIVVVLYVGLIEPLRASSQKLRSGLPALEARREIVRAQTRESAARPPATTTPSKATLDPALIQAALERHRLKASSPTVEAVGTDRARLALARVPFFAIWPFFQTLQNDQGLRVVSLRVDRLDASTARVEATIAAGDR